MRRIHLNRSLLVGAAAALIFGAAAATLVTSSEERVDDSPLRVPVGGIGDRVVYAYYAADPASEDSWFTYGPQKIGAVVAPEGDRNAGEPQPQGPRAFEVVEVRDARDAAHVRHPSLLILSNHSHPAVPGLSVEVAEYVDLDQRIVFRVDEDIAFKPDDRKAPQAPPGSVQTSAFELRDPSLPGLTYQGLELRLGQVLRDRTTPASDRFGDHVRDVREREWVSDRAKIDGVDAYAVTYEVQYRVLLGVAGMPSSDAAKPPAGQPTAEAVAVRAWRTDWMSAQQPYALLRETGMRVGSEADAPDAQRAAFRLQRVETGRAFVPWAGHPGDHWALARSDLERTSGSQRHPADGAGSTLGYPLEEALRAVRDDPALIQFTLWRQSHSDHRLVGARYGLASDPANLPRVRWDLVFADAKGDAFHLQTERAPGTTARTNREVGTIQVPPFAPDDFPETPPTLGALERTWADYVSEARRAEGFNYVRWGVDIFGGECIGTAKQRTSAAAVTEASTLRYLEGGHAAPGACPGGGGAVGSSIVIDAATGLAVSVYESDFPHRFGAKNLAFTEAMREKWSRAPATLPPEVRPPEASTTAASSASAFFVFLTVYFWPALKFGAAKVVLFGAYAKIGKEDLLNNPTRESILHLIRTHPGIHASDIARQVNAGWGTIVYHLSVLQRNKAVTSLVDGRHKRFFPADTVDYSKRGQLAALMNANTKMIYEIIEGTPGIVQGELSGRTGLTIPTVIWHLQRLETAGLVGRDKEGRRFHYFANPLVPTQPTPPKDAPEVQ